MRAIPHPYAPNGMGAVDEDGNKHAHAQSYNEKGEGHMITGEGTNKALGDTSGSTAIYAENSLAWTSAGLPDPWKPLLNGTPTYEVITQCVPWGSLKVIRRPMRYPWTTRKVTAKSRLATTGGHILGVSPAIDPWTTRKVTAKSRRATTWWTYLVSDL